MLFKGEGFYVTDYRSSEYREKVKAEKPGASSGESAPAKEGKSGSPTAPRTEKKKKSQEKKGPED